MDGPPGAQSVQKSREAGRAVWGGRPPRLRRQPLPASPAATDALKPLVIFSQFNKVRLNYCWEQKGSSGCSSAGSMS